MSKMDFHSQLAGNVFKIDNEDTKENPVKQKGFNPYVVNNGTVAAVAGKDFCKVVGDTRCSLGYSILSRDLSKISQLTKKCVIATSGMRADAINLHKVLQWKVKTYRARFNKDPDIDVIARILGNTLYGRRFFPYYTFNLLCGVNSEGEGAMYGYDAVGSYDRVNCGSMGSGSELVTPILDNQVKDHNVLEPLAPTDVDAVENVLRDAMHAATERDIYTGDNLEMVTIDKDGVRIEKEAMRRD
mmetsp:Transcript_21593/g.24014  ORF Transcript_21593/g.24014 Transcript_21593/m.24014 type:complete len:243 (+) Transcript_21593:13-741(+)